jgi:hypothetical protein
LSTISLVILTMAFLAVIVLMPDKPKRDFKYITDDDAINDIDICKTERTDPPKWIIGRDNALRLCWLTNVGAPYAVPFDCALLENCRG